MPRFGRIKAQRPKATKSWQSWAATCSDGLAAFAQSKTSQENRAIHKFKTNIGIGHIGCLTITRMCSTWFYVAQDRPTTFLSPWPSHHRVPWLSSCRCCPTHRYRHRRGETRAAVDVGFLCQSYGASCTILYDGTFLLARMKFQT